MSIERGEGSNGSEETPALGPQPSAGESLAAQPPTERPLFPTVAEFVQGKHDDLPSTHIAPHRTLQDIANDAPKKSQEPESEDVKVVFAQHTVSEDNSDTEPFVTVHSKSSKGDKYQVEKAIRDITLRAKTGKEIEWKQQPNAVIMEVIKKASEETGVPVSMMGTQDIRSVRYEFLSGRTLNGLYDRFDAEAKDTDKDALDLLFKERVAPTADDIATAVQIGRSVDWNRIPSTVIKEVLEKASEETGVPASMLGFSEMSRSYEFLDGRTLGGLHKYFKHQGKESGKDAASAMHERANISISSKDVITSLKSGRKVPWDKVPRGVLREVLESVAAEREIDKPASMLTYDDISKHLGHLEGHSLQGLYDHARRAEKPEGQTAIEYILEKANVEVTERDIEQAAAKGQNIRWDRIPDHVANTLLREVSELTGETVEELSLNDDLRIPLAILGSKSILRDIELLASEGIRSAVAISRELDISVEEAQRALELRPSLMQYRRVK